MTTPPNRRQLLRAWIERRPVAAFFLAVGLAIAVFWIGWDLTGPHEEDATRACHSAVKADLPEPDLAVWGFSQQVDSFDSGWDVSGSVSEQGHDWHFSCTVSKDGNVLSHYLSGG